MKLLAKKIVFELPRYLSDKDVKYWASMTTWLRTEAVMLSLGLDPRRSGDSRVHSKEASRLRNEFNERNDLMENVLESQFREQYEYSDNECLCDPETFVGWAKANFSSFPENLYEAVLDFYNKPLSILSDDDAQKTKGNAGSTARWAYQDEIKKKALRFLSNSVGGNCICNHLQLRDYLYNNGADENGNTLFEYPDIEYDELMKLLKEAAKEFLLKIDPNSTRIVGIEGYIKNEGICEDHSKNH